MATAMASATRPLIEAAELKEHLDSGKPVTILDARSAKAWVGSPLRIPGDIRVDADAFEPADEWPKDCLTVAYCT